MKSRRFRISNGLIDYFSAAGTDEATDSELCCVAVRLSASRGSDDSVALGPAHFPTIQWQQLAAGGLTGRPLSTDMKPHQ